MFVTKMTPTHNDIVASLHRTQQTYTGDNNSTSTADDEESVAEAHKQESRELLQTIELLNVGVIGYMPTKKKSGMTRISFENWNSLGIFTQSWKMDKLNSKVQRLDLDVITGCETQTDWRFVPPKRQLEQLLTPGLARTTIAANNTMGQKINRDQVGGTAAAVLGQLNDVLTEVGKDTSGLGRWAWIRLGQKEHIHTYIMAAYCPCCSKGAQKW